MASQPFAQNMLREKNLYRGKHMPRLMRCRGPVNNLEFKSTAPLHIEVARVTGLEPAASGVTGQRSNQLSYTR